MLLFLETCLVNGQRAICRGMSFVFDICMLPSRSAGVFIAERPKIIYTCLMESHRRPNWDAKLGYVSRYLQRQLKCTSLCTVSSLQVYASLYAIQVDVQLQQQPGFHVRETRKKSATSNVAWLAKYVTHTTNKMLKCLMAGYANIWLRVGQLGLQHEQKPNRKVTNTRAEENRRVWQKIREKRR